MRGYIYTLFSAELVAVLMLFLTSRTEALVYCITNGVAVHQQAPTGTLVQSGWQQTVLIDASRGSLSRSNFLGTIIYSNALLTADHISEIRTNDTFILEGKHTLTSRVATNGSDLAIYFFSPPVTNREHIALINIESTIDTNAFVVYQGCGTERGAMVTSGTLTNGWMWSATNVNNSTWGTRRWGVNQTFDATPDGLCALAAFDNNNDPDECMFSIGDSGGPGFINTGSGWKVAMVNYAVDPMTFTRSTNAPVSKFNATLYDCAGLYYQGDSGWSWMPPEASPAPCLLICSRTAQRIQWITNTVAGLSFPSDIGIAWTCQTHHPSAAQAASGLWFDIIATNAGPYTARNVAIDLTWPKGIHIHNSSASHGSLTTNRWSIPALSDGSVATLRVDTVVWNATSYWGTNRATLTTSDKPDSNTSNNVSECPIFLPSTASLILLW
jgi:hypothetical protein